MNVHAKYIIGILVSIIVLIAAGWLTGITDVADKMQFGLAMSSIILAVFTIFFTVTSNANLPHTVNELRGVTKKVTKATTDLQEQLKAIPQRFDTMESKIEEQSTKFTEALQKSGTSDTPQPAANLDPLIPSFLQRISIYWCFALYAASLAFEYERIFNFRQVAHVIESDTPYVHGFIVAAASFGVITWQTDESKGTRVGYVHPSVVQDAKKVLLAKWMKAFPNDAEQDRILTRSVKALENHFMLPEEESSDSNDSDDSTEEHYE